MNTITVIDEQDRRYLLCILGDHTLPCTVQISEGADRSRAQNRLAFKWYKEISEQSGDTPDEIRAQCKLTLGVPIMRHECEDFRKLYDEMVRPLPLAHKLALMLEPFDLAVTRGMTTKQMGQFLDAMWKRFAVEMGMKLTEPDNLVGELPSRVKGEAA